MAAHTSKARTLFPYLTPEKGASSPIVAGSQQVGEHYLYVGFYVGQVWINRLSC